MLYIDSTYLQVKYSVLSMEIGWYDSVSSLSCFSRSDMLVEKLEEVFQIPSSGKTFYVKLELSGLQISYKIQCQKHLVPG